MDAIDRADLQGTLADHTDDIVMFDVPPPHAGYRGMEQYETAWPEFMQWQSERAMFELTELEVTAGSATWPTRSRSCDAARPSGTRRSRRSGCG